MIKCPGCGASTSAKRQICHMCGHLLSASQEKGKEKEELQLVSEELKAAAEAAVREAREASRPARVTPTAQPQAAGEAMPIRTRRRRETRIITLAAIITVVALGSLGYRYLPRRGGEPEFRQATPRTPAAAGPTQVLAEPPATEIVPAPLPGPETPSAPAPPVEEPFVQPELDQLVEMEDSAAEGLRLYFAPLLSRIDADLGTSFSSSETNYRGTMSQESQDAAVVTVSFQGSGFFGDANILLRRYDRGWQVGWEATHYKDIRLTFSPPVVVSAGWESGAGQASISGASIGSGGYEPLSSLPEQPIEYIYG